MCATVHLPQLDLNSLVKPQLRLFEIRDTEKTDVKFNDIGEMFDLMAGLLKLNILESQYSV